MSIAFLAFDKMLDTLTAELQNRFSADTSKAVFFGDLLYFSETPAVFQNNNEMPYWACDTLLNPCITKIQSITDASKILKSLQRNWSPYSFTQFRRTKFIQEKLPYVNLKPRNFPFDIPKSKMGIYSLLDKDTMLFASETSSKLPCGKIQFVEDHENPPSRAYLKLQEALVRFRDFYDVDLPSSASRCFDAGACPGGWTWVLRQLGSEVFAVDRSMLDEKLMADKGVFFKKHDAFTLTPKEIGAFDWIFSDVICYPSRLYEWVNIWIKSGLAKNMICTIKMQGPLDWEIIQKFAAIPESHIVHLCYNKHELTWMWHNSKE